MPGLKDIGALKPAKVRIDGSNGAPFAVPVGHEVVLRIFLQRCLQENRLEFLRNERTIWCIDIRSLALILCVLSGCIRCGSSSRLTALL